MPRVSIGIPVFNGENFLSKAVASVLAQTYKDFEIVISDNGSTDATQSICQDYVALDARVRYFRQGANIGAAPNFNFLFHKCVGEYFKWAAHDDLLDPAFLEKCVAALDANPDAVLCHTSAIIIDDHDEQTAKYVNPLKLDGHEPEDRFGELVQFHRSARYEIFGLFRRSALENTALIGSYTDGDGVLLAHVGLRGRIIGIQEPLFFPRRHAEQSQRLISNKNDYDNWFNPKNAGKLSLPHFRILREYAALVNGEPLSWRQKVSCYGSVLRQASRIWRLLRGDLKRFLIATFHRRTEGMQQRIAHH